VGRDLQCEERGEVLWLSLHRAPLNVLDLSSIGELTGLLSPLVSRMDLKVVVIRSAVPGVFSAGVEIRDHTRERAPAMLNGFHALLKCLLTLPQASIAAVDGACLGGALELVSACDLVVSSPASTFGQPEIDVGCFPPAACVFLPRLLGKAAHEMILTGSRLAAPEALRIGLLSRVATDLEAETEALASKLCGKSRAVLALSRRALLEGSYGQPLDALDRVQRIYTQELLETEDADEGVRAFLEKRPPHWKNR
jgi:cyclohexa-1,5-dienecarbonyl-CoA hydratase